MRILTHTFRKHSFRIVLTLYLVFTSNLKKKNYYPNKFKFTCLFQLLFPNLLNYSQLKLIKLMELVQGGGGRKKNFVYNSLLDIDINQIHLNWYTLHAIPCNLANTLQIMVQITYQIASYIAK